MKLSAACEQHHRFREKLSVTARQKFDFYKMQLILEANELLLLLCSRNNFIHFSVVYILVEIEIINVLLKYSLFM